MKVANFHSGDTGNYVWDSAQLEAYKSGQLLGEMEPEKRFYAASKQGITHVAIRTRLNEDLYISLASVGRGQGTAHPLAPRCKCGSSRS